MTDLQHRHLVTMTLTVDFAGMVSIGATPTGLRRIAPVTGGSFSGERLNNVIAIGTGERTATGPIYSIFEIG